MDGLVAAGGCGRRNRDLDELRKKTKFSTCYFPHSQRKVVFSSPFWLQGYKGPLHGTMSTTPDEIPHHLRNENSVGQIHLEHPLSTPLLLEGDSHLTAATDLIIEIINRTIGSREAPEDPPLAGYPGTLYG